MQVLSVLLLLMGQHPLERKGNLAEVAVAVLALRKILKMPMMKLSVIM